MASQRGKYANQLDPNLPDPFARPPSGNLFEQIGSAMESPLRRIGEVASRAGSRAAGMARDWLPPLFAPPGVSPYQRQPTGPSVRMAELAPPWTYPAMGTSAGGRHGPATPARRGEEGEVPGTVVPKKQTADFAQAYWKFQQLQSAVTSATGKMMQFAEKASPTHVNTLMNSIDLVSAKLGGVLLPAIELVSKSLQGWANWMDQNSWMTKGIGEGSGDLIKGLPMGQMMGGGMAGTFMSSIGRKIFGDMKFDFGGSKGETFTEGSAKWLQSFDDKKSGQRGWGGFAADSLRWLTGTSGRPDTSMAHMPKSQIMSTEDYIDKLITASMDLDEQQVKLLETQMKHMEDLVGLVTEIKNKPTAQNTFR